MSMSPFPNCKFSMNAKWHLCSKHYYDICFKNNDLFLPTFWKIFICSTLIVYLVIIKTFNVETFSFIEVT